MQMRKRQTQFQLHFSLKVNDDFLDHQAKQFLLLASFQIIIQQTDLRNRAIAYGISMEDNRL